jgi:aminoglycoside phosphotransferase family enzyme/predicted kinase
LQPSYQAHFLKNPMVMSAGSSETWQFLRDGLSWAQRIREGRESGAMVPDLLRREAYPAPAPSGVELRHTHASWVFLTDSDAWKVKRPVNYGFLDFSDPEKRRRCCEAEVAIGRRLAPDVYRGVATIHASPTGHTFVGPGPVVDHAVQMRRLPDEDSAAMLLACGRLAPVHLERLAEHLARFYAIAPATPELGAAAVLSAHIEENYAQTLPFADRLLDRALIEQVHAGQRALMDIHRERLQRRVADGHIRDGHGDLRLEHVYFDGGDPHAPLVIDPIEFNARLRCGDVALDVAFLAMDLDAHHRPDLAAGFLSAFAGASNDYDFYPLLDLYLSYRAWVRAKVACLVAADARTAPAKVTRKAREAEEFFNLAASYLHPTPAAAPVVVVSGAPGAGKSALAGALAVALQAPVVSSDLTRKHLAGLTPTARGGASLYTEEHSRRTYAELIRRAGAVVASGRGVVLDATFRLPQDRAAARALAHAERRPFLLIELDCDDRVLRERLERRAGRPSVSDARGAQLAPFRRSYQPPTELPAGERLILEGTRAPEELVQRVRAALSDR